MVKELNYLSERIEKVEHEINLCEFAIDLDASTPLELKALHQEKTFLDNLLNYITINEVH